MTPTRGICLDPDRLRRIYHRCTGDVYILYRIIRTLAQRHNEKSMTAGTGDIGYSYPVCTGFERNAVVVIGDGDIRNGDIFTLADIETVGVFSRVGAFGCWMLRPLSNLRMPRCCFRL